MEMKFNIKEYNFNKWIFRSVFIIMSVYFFLILSVSNISLQEAVKTDIYVYCNETQCFNQYYDEGCIMGNYKCLPMYFYQGDTFKYNQDTGELIKVDELPKGNIFIDTFSNLLFYLLLLAFTINDHFFNRRLKNGNNNNRTNK